MQQGFTEQDVYKRQYIYSAKHADATVTRRRSESRQGVRISDEKKAEMDELITKLVKKGQPLTHILSLIHIYAVSPLLAISSI